MVGGEANIRVGSVERESALHALSTHLAEDRITIDEYEQRCTSVTAARTRAELLTLFEDLPEPHPRMHARDELAERPDPDPPQESLLLDKRPVKPRRVAVVAIVGVMVAAVVVTVAITSTWWALIPALLVLAIVLSMN